MRDVTWRGYLVMLLISQCIQSRAAHPPITIEATEELPWKDDTQSGLSKSPEKPSKSETAKNLNHVVETYMIEHSISEPGAIMSAREINPADFESFAIGCDECTKNEIDYCSGSALIQDHCCCDGRYIESFPYVPHTCYRGPEVCKPVKSDCEEYIRIRDCCCRVHLASKWKTRFASSSAYTNNCNNKTIRWLWILPWIVFTILF